MKPCLAGRQVCATFVCLCVVIFSSAQVFDITTYGAVGNGSSLNTQFIQDAVDACHNAGGGTVEVPAGTFVTGTIILKSNVTIHIAQGGTIKGSSDLNDYPDIIPQKRSYTDHYPQRSVFFAEGQENIAIIGEGTFDGNGLSVSFFQDASHKPFGFRFFSCRNVRYEGLKLRNSGFWMMHNFDIDTLVIKNLDIVNHAFGNNDGIDIDCCRDVIVDSCKADCNDDPLVLKTTSPIGSRNISISNCTVASYSRAIKMGTETHGPYQNIHIKNITVQFSTQGPFGSNTPASCGINFSAVDGGSIENVLVENVTMMGVKTPILVRLGNRARKYTDTAATPGVGFIRNVELRNINATATTNITSSITGIPNYRAANIRLKDIDITFPGGQAALSDSFVVPEKISDKPEANIFGDTLPASGLYLRHLDSLYICNVNIHPQQPDQRPAFIYDDVLNLDTTASACTASAIVEANKQIEISVFPNPVFDELIVKAQFLKAVELFDVNGRSLLFSSCHGNTAAINFSKFPAGIYLLKANTPNGSITQKILKF